MNPLYHRIYRVVRHIPKGRVATYGLVARLAGRPGAARTVGWALSALDEDNDVPWWRVINAAGRISLSTDHSAVLQRALLLREGVRFALPWISQLPEGDLIWCPGGLLWFRWLALLPAHGTTHRGLNVLFAKSAS